jgi:hypothetical protein
MHAREYRHGETPLLRLIKPTSRMAYRGHALEAAVPYSRPSRFASTTAATREEQPSLA